MNELENFLNKLTDHELAIFYMNRYAGFLENSKKKIDSEIVKRNLIQENLNLLGTQKLIIESVEKFQICQKCGSNRLFIETDYKEIPISEFSSAEIAMDSYRCRLCGFNPGKAVPKNGIDRFKKIFNKNKQSRVNKWNKI